jgi:dUTP pyrophosphatase
MIQFKLAQDAKLPERGSALAAGLDIHTVEDFILYPQERMPVSTGVILASCPTNMYLRIAPRSKLALNYGVDVLAGVVDCDYRGEIKVILLNTSTFVPVEFKRGDAIAQLIPELVDNLVAVREAGEVSITLRGSKGINCKDERR